MAQGKLNLVKTPEKNIPIGALTRLENGEPALEIKRPGKEEYDTISLSNLVCQMAAILSPISVAK